MFSRFIKYRIAVIAVKILNLKLEIVTDDLNALDKFHLLIASSHNCVQAANFQLLAIKSYFPEPWTNRYFAVFEVAFSMQ